MGNNNKKYSTLADKYMKSLTTSLHNRTKLRISIAAKLREIYKKNNKCAHKAMRFKKQKLKYYDNFLPERVCITVKSYFICESFWYNELIIFDVLENDCIYILYKSYNEYYDMSKDYIEHSQTHKEKVSMAHFVNDRNFNFHFVIAVENSKDMEQLIAPLSIEL